MSTNTDTLESSTRQLEIDIRDLDQTVSRAADFLLSIQQPDGHWVGEFEGDTILETEYVILLKILGNGDEETIRKAAEYVRRKQLPSGGWAIYTGGPADLSASVKAYWVLKLTGSSVDDPNMKRARNEILAMGGAERCNSYTLFYLAILGQIDWDRSPAVPPEIVLLPNWFYINLYEFSSWSRTFIVPLSILWAHRPVHPLPPEQGIQELFIAKNDGWIRTNPFTWKRFFTIADKLLKCSERIGFHPLRKKALAVAEKWMLEHFEGSDGLGAIYPPIVYSLLAMRAMGYPDDNEHVVRARRELEDLRIDEEETVRLQPCKSPVWDTAIAINALLSAELPNDHPQLLKSADWIFSKEVRRRGDWSVKRPNLNPGGWAFEYNNEFYPDIDDTAMVLLALRQLDLSRRSDAPNVMKRALDWLLGMHNRDGGWGSFDVDNDRQLLCHIPFADHNAMIDPSTVDITSRILEMLAALGYDQSNPHVAKAIRYTLNEQEEDGAWFGRWGVNYIYGTWQSLKGLAAIGIPADHPSMRKGAKWLLHHQNIDGGWGESCGTYDDPSDRGKGPSTPSQTAWALIGLMVSGYENSDSVKRGIEFLISAQNENGSWDEPEWTGTGFPRVFYIRYHMYRHSFPLWALGMYAKLLKSGSDSWRIS
jgi:squalene-hopene/tetraprenyl-beta-curcumene cyclase